ncbi:MAG: Gfo/Idh/MocA family oxidoreductase [Proteobacteria bacterium]|nr:Gfo/Idh/MocA family oxidoreductase [Pseudomonadota bacterium]
MPQASRIRVSVIGAGWFAAQNHIPTLAGRSDVVLDGVCRLGEAPLARVREHFGFAFASENHRDLLARKPDAVVVSSPHHLHCEHARDAIESGAHVLVEKPLTLDPAEAWDLVSRARARGRHLLVANGYHYLPHLEEIRTRLARGAVGSLEYVTCSFISATRAVFEGDVGLGHWSTAFFRPDRSTWQDPAQGGGFAYGQLSHSIALMLWLTGLEPLALNASSFEKGGIDLTDAAAISFRGGAVGHLGGAAAMPEGSRALLRLLIAGNDGMMTVELDRDWAEIRRHDGTTIKLDIEPDAWIYRCDGPPNALVDLALGGNSNPSPGEIGASTVAVIEAMRRSARAGGGRAEIIGPSSAIRSDRSIQAGQQ